MENHGMDLRIAVCDDEEIYREEIMRACREILKNRPTSIDSFESGDRLMACGKEYDLIFLDIQMEGLDGIRVKNLLEACGRSSRIIFMTSHEERMIEAFGANVIGFMKKPISKSALEALIWKVERIRRKYTVKLEEAGNIYTFLTGEICYIEAEDKYTRVHTINGAALLRKTLTEWEAILPSVDFCRVNRSAIVSMEYFDRKKDEVIFRDGKRIRISRKDREKIQEKYEEFLRKKAVEAR